MTIENEPFLLITGTKSQIIADFLADLIKQDDIEDESYQKPVRSSKKDEPKHKNEGGDSK